MTAKKIIESIKDLLKEQAGEEIFNEYVEKEEKDLMNYGNDLSHISSAIVLNDLHHELENSIKDVKISVDKKNKNINAFYMYEIEDIDEHVYYIYLEEM